MSKSPRIMGAIRLIYAVSLIIIGLLVPSEAGISIFDFIGIGFYMGAFSSGFLLAK